MPPKHTAPSARRNGWSAAIVEGDRGVGLNVKPYAVHTGSVLSTILGLYRQLFAHVVCQTSACTLSIGIKHTALRMLIRFLSLLGIALAFNSVPCPLPATLNATELVVGGTSLLAKGSASAARSCLVRGNAPLPLIARAQFAAFNDEVTMLPSGGENFAATWDELLELMRNKQIFSLDELDLLRSPVDVLILHGQLACLADIGSAISSLAAALRIRESPQVRELVARIALGKGHAAAALAHVTLALRGLRDGAAGHERGAMRVLQLQAALMVENDAIAINNDDNPTVVATVSDENQGVVALVRGSSASSSSAAFFAVRSLVRMAFRKARVSFSKDDPMAFSGGLDEEDEEDEDEDGESLVPAEAKELRHLTVGGDSASLSVGHLLAPTNAWLRAGPPHVAATFRADGYVALRGLLPAEYFAALTVRATTLFGGAGESRIAEDAPQNRRTLWNDELALYIGLRLVPIMSAIVGRPLVSVYSFLIRYDKGGQLHPHVDRAQNAISVSLNIGREPSNSEPWPVWVSPTGEGEAAGVPIALRPNDALLYGGVDHMHFRRPLRDGASVQVIFGFRDINETHCNSQ